MKIQKIDLVLVVFLVFILIFCLCQLFLCDKSQAQEMKVCNFQDKGFDINIYTEGFDINIYTDSSSVEKFQKIYHELCQHLGKKLPQGTELDISLVEVKNRFEEFSFIYYDLKINTIKIDGKSYECASKKICFGPKGMAKFIHENIKYIKKQGEK